MLVAVALITFAISIPLYFLAVMGAGLSPAQPHLGLPLACLLWTPPVLCIASSVGILTLQRPARRWHWFLTVTLSFLSALEMVWTLLLLLEG